MFRKKDDERKNYFEIEKKNNTVIVKKSTYYRNKNLIIFNPIRRNVTYTAPPTNIIKFHKQKKNKKTPIPIKLMNLVSFINNQTKISTNSNINIHNINNIKNFINNPKNRNTFKDKKRENKNIVDNKIDYNSVNINDNEYIISLINENICQVISKTGIIGTGFFCKIPFPYSWMLLPALVTNCKILDESDISLGEKIKLTLNNKNITLTIDNNRKTYSSQEYQISIVEIRIDDNLNIDRFLDVKILDTNQLKKIFLMHHKKNKNDKNFSSGIIIDLDINNNYFTHSCKSTKESLGSPIISFVDYKIIGINAGIIDNSNYSKGILFNNTLLFDFYNKSKKMRIENRKKYTIIFHMIKNKKDYYCKEIEDNMMFGEIVLYFLFESGIDFDENLIFTFNQKEIPPYSCCTFEELNLQDKSKIFVEEKQKKIKEKLLNIIFISDNIHDKQINILGNNNMILKELLLKYCLKARCTYENLFLEYLIRYNSKKISSCLDNTLKTLGFQDNSKLELMKINNIPIE